MTLKQLETELKNLKLWLDTFIPDKYNQISGLDADKPSICFLPTIYTSTDTHTVHFWAADRWIVSHEGAATYAPFTGATHTEGAAAGLVPATGKIDPTKTWTYLGQNGKWSPLPLFNKTTNMAGIIVADTKTPDDAVLHADHTWKVPPNDNTTYELFKGGDATTGTDGLVSFPLKDDEIDQANKNHYLGGDNRFHDLGIQVSALELFKPFEGGDGIKTGIDGLVRSPLKDDEVDQTTKTHYLGGDNFFHDLNTQLALLQYKKTDTTYEMATDKKAGLLKLRDNTDDRSEFYVMNGLGKYVNMYMTNYWDGSTEWGYSCDYINTKLKETFQEINETDFTTARAIALTGQYLGKISEPLE